MACHVKLMKYKNEMKKFADTKTKQKKNHAI